MPIDMNPWADAMTGSTRLLAGWRLGLALVLVVALTTSARAQQRPLVTEDPEPVGEGLVLLEAGFDYLRDQPYPVSGLEGHLFSLPTFGVSLGVSSIAEIQIDGLSYQRLSVTERRAAPLSGLVNFAGEATSDMDDIVIGAKVRVVGEGDRRPAFALRFATKLPNAGNESGLGLDTMDFVNTLLVGKTMRALRLVGNFGMGILSDPTRGDRQNDVVVYGLSMTYALDAGRRSRGRDQRACQYPARRATARNRYVWLFQGRRPSDERRPPV